MGTDPISSELLNNNQEEDNLGEDIQPSESCKESREIRLMDTITFKKGLKPVNWLFTDMNGQIQSKDISHITVNDVIKAFLINLNSNQKKEFDNDDLLQFLETSESHKKICFAIKDGKRELLDINHLIKIKSKYPRGLDAL